jgi:hypothetical protein
MGEGREVGPPEQSAAQPPAQLPPVPLPPLVQPTALPQYPATPTSALLLARKQLDEDTTKTWLLVALCAVSGLYFSAMFLMFFVQGLFFGMFGATNQHVGVLQSLGTLASVLIAMGLSFILPTLVVLGSNRAYKRQYDWITAELVHGDLALMLVDETYGRLIQEWREHKFQLRNITGGEVHLGDKFALRLIHFGSYYMEYFRISQGQREFTVTPASSLNCWTDGIALGCMSCVSDGCLAWITIFLPLRIVYTYR